jgi:hypothetical protein
MDLAMNPPNNPTLYTTETREKIIPPADMPYNAGGEHLTFETAFQIQVGQGDCEMGKRSLPLCTRCPLLCSIGVAESLLLGARRPLVLLLYAALVAPSCARLPLQSAPTP